MPPEPPGAEPKRIACLNNENLVLHAPLDVGGDHLTHVLCLLAGGTRMLEDGNVIQARCRVVAPGGLGDIAPGVHPKERFADIETKRLMRPGSFVVDLTANPTEERATRWARANAGVSPYRAPRAERDMADEIAIPDPAEWLPHWRGHQPGPNSG